MSELQSSHSYVIEVAGNTAGIVVRREHGKPGYRFFAASRPFNRLEGALFRDPHEAERAARRARRRSS